MARAQVPDGILRGCPTCGTKVSEVDMGLRDFRWVNEVLPGKIGGMDLDYCLTQVRGNGRGLLLEFKPEGAYLSLGHRLTFGFFVKKGVDVWVLWENRDGTVSVGPVNKWGKTPVIEKMTKTKAAGLVRDWWHEGLDDG